MGFSVGGGSQFESNATGNSSQHQCTVSKANASAKGLVPEGMIPQIPSLEVWGPHGPGSALMYICMGGAGTVFRGVWKVRLIIHLSIQRSLVYDGVNLLSLTIVSDLIMNTIIIQGLDVAVKKMESMTSHREQVRMDLFAGLYL